MSKTLPYIIGLAIFLSEFLSDALAQDGIIKGRVIANDKSALPAATVVTGQITVITNTDGSFSISLKPNIYTITISYSGYQPHRQEVIIKSNETIELDFILSPNEQMGEVSVLGSRSTIRRSNLNTPVPIDVISGSQLPRSHTDLTQQLSIVVPSFNAPPQTVGNSNFVNPATLRGLGPDETLVLVNGRRRYTTPIVFLQYNIGYGTAGTDLNAIPSAAIENIEILRDGATAQHGSDAIAGVINLQLKKSTGTNSLHMHLGQTYEGDGETLSFDINVGVQLYKKGFLNLTLSTRFSNPTQRNGIYEGTVYDNLKARDDSIVLARGFDRLNHRPIGNPQVFNSSLIINGGYPLSNKTNLFWTVTSNFRSTNDGASSPYRYPKDSTTVIIDLYPDGFQPKISNTLLDGSVIAGIEGKTNNGWQWDFGSVFGVNTSIGDVYNSNNASQFVLGKNAQTYFELGSTSFSQNTNNLNFTKNFASQLQNMKSFTVSLGGEFRFDHFKVNQGEEASWKDYAPNSGRQWGSQGTVGRSPGQVVNNSRHISAVYAELEMDRNEKFLWNLAGRYEYYNDFGGNLAGKLAICYKFSDYFLLRGSISNGFRAPAIQQRYFSNTNQVPGTPGISIIETYRNDSREAASFGIDPLQAEKSINISGGITSKISSHISFTLDAYWIQINNKVILTGQIPRSSATPRVGQILDSLGHTDIDGVRFFTNAVSTRTKGVDLVVTGSWPIHKSILEISLAGNYNSTNIYKLIQPAKNLPDNPVYQNTVINMEERGRLEQAQPLFKIVLAINYKTGKWEFGTRQVHFGKAAHLYAGIDRSRDEFFSPKIVSSFTIGYSLKKWVTIKVGARNIFNVYPDKTENKLNKQSGLVIYDFNSTQIGYNGGYYFINLFFNL